MSKDLRVAAVQLTSTTDVEKNLRRSCDWVGQAALEGAKFILLPENFGFLGRDADKLPFAQKCEDGSFLAPLREVAVKYGVYILAGSIPEQAPDAQRTYNTSVLVGSRGETVATYRKIHLFDVALADGFAIRESDSVMAGDTPVRAEIEGWQVGLSVCYDLRFPELYRRLAGADILAIPAAFMLHTGKDHWDVLLRARAIENQAFVIAPGQFGIHEPKRVSWGKSQIIDPWGTPLAIAPEREGFIASTLCKKDLERTRNQVPCLEHRKIGI